MNAFLPPYVFEVIVILKTSLHFIFEIQINFIEIQLHAQHIHFKCIVNEFLKKWMHPCDAH